MAKAANSARAKASEGSWSAEKYSSAPAPAATGVHKKGRRSATSFSTAAAKTARNLRPNAPKKGARPWSEWRASCALRATSCNCVQPQIHVAAKESSLSRAKESVTAGRFWEADEMDF